MIHGHVLSELKLFHLEELRAIVGLLLQGRDRPLQCVDGLGVVLVRRQVVRVLHLADLADGSSQAFGIVFARHFIRPSMTRILC